MFVETSQERDFFFRDSFIRCFLYVHFKCYLKSSLYRTPKPAPLLTHSHILALEFPSTGACKV
jgi:hypothetical protein